MTIKERGTDSSTDDDSRSDGQTHSISPMQRINQAGEVMQLIVEDHGQEVSNGPADIQEDVESIKEVQEEAAKFFTWHYQQYIKYSYQEKKEAGALISIILGILCSAIAHDSFQEIFWYLVSGLSLLAAQMELREGNTKLGYKASNHLQVAIRMKRLYEMIDPQNTKEVNLETLRTVYDLCLRPAQHLKLDPEFEPKREASSSSLPPKLMDGAKAEKQFISLFLQQKGDGDSTSGTRSKLSLVELAEKVSNFRRQHTLAYERYQYFQLLLSTFLLSSTLIAGILAFLGTSKYVTVTEKSNNVFAVCIGALSGFSIFLEVLIIKLKYGVRSDMHNRASLSLKRLSEKIHFASKVMKFEPKGEQAKHVEILYNICYIPYENVLPNQITEAFDELQGMLKGDEKKSVVEMARTNLFYTIASYKWFPWFFKFHKGQNASDALEKARFLNTPNHESRDVYEIN